MCASKAPTRRVTAVGPERDPFRHGMAAGKLASTLGGRLLPP